MAKTTSDIFIENLRRLRKKKFPSQSSFADEVGLSERGYQRYEQGESFPTPDILDRFSKKLGCHPWDLILPEAIVARYEDKSRHEYLGLIVSRLGALDETELRRVLTFIDGISSLSGSRSKGHAG